MELELILGIFLLVVFLVWKLVKSFLDSTAKSGKGEKVHDIFEPLGKESDDIDCDGTVRHEAGELPGVGYMSIKDIAGDRRTDVTDGKENAGKPLVDPKKLIVYSEIMNPKYKD